MLLNTPQKVVNGSDVLDVSLTEQRLDKLFRVEGEQVFLLLADADVADGELQFAGNGDDDTSFCRPVEFGQHDARDAGAFGELPRLLQAVLAGGGVEDPGLKAGARKKGSGLDNRSLRT